MDIQIFRVGVGLKKRLERQRPCSGAADIDRLIELYRKCGNIFQIVLVHIDFRDDLGHAVGDHPLIQFRNLLRYLRGEIPAILKVDGPHGHEKIIRPHGINDYSGVVKGIFPDPVLDNLKVGVAEEGLVEQRAFQISPNTFHSGIGWRASSICETGQRSDAVRLRRGRRG